MAAPVSLRAAEQLEVSFDGVVIPVEINDLVAWARSGGESNTELGIWLELMDPVSRKGVLELLRAPLITDRSMARQMLKSWAGRRLVDEVADLVQVDDDTVGLTVLNTLERLLNRQPQVNSLDLLEALPAKRVRLDLDGLVDVAAQWRQQLQQQQALVRRLDQIPINAGGLASADAMQPALVTQPELQLLPVAHRKRPLRLQLWHPTEAKRSQAAPSNAASSDVAPSYAAPSYAAPSRGSRSKRNWVVLMPGLGGSPDHFRWLGRTLSNKGWPVVVLEHPGSDAAAVEAWLQGQRRPPGAEVLPDRLKDLDAVLQAKASGVLPVEGERVVLAGHSLGSLTALLASGLRPRPGLDWRCKRALDDLPLSNLSRLLQCQMTEVSLPETQPPAQLAGVVGMNSFGSLLWPRRRPQPLPVPALFTGGTLDLITPPLQEQLELLLATAPQPGSAAVLVEGASHFSPIRVEGQDGDGKGDDLFQLGEELVGVQPLEVQALLAGEIVDFLERLEANALASGRLAAASGHLHRQVGNLHLHRIDASAAAGLISD